MEWAGLVDMDGKPSKITIPHANTNLATKKQFMESVIGNFVDKYILQDLNAEKTLNLKRQSHVTGINTNMHAYSLGKENYRQIILIIVATKFICFDKQISFLRKSVL